MFADSALVAQYANQLKGLTLQQAELALSTKILTNEQKQQILSEAGLIATENTIQAELLQTTLAQAGLNSEKQNAILKDVGLMNAQTGELLTQKACTKAKLEEQLALHGVTGAQTENIISTLGLSGANTTATVSFEVLGASIKKTTAAIWAFLTTNPVGWATMAGVALAGVVLGVNAYNKKQEELREEAEQSAQEIDNQSKSLDELKQKYIEICDSTDDEATKSQQLNDIKQELVDVYGFEKDALKELNDERERGLDLLDGEFEKKNRNSRNNWLEDNKDIIKKANEEMASDGVDYFTTYLSKNNIASSILELFDKQEAFGDTGYVNLEFDYTDTADRLNKLKNIYNEILDVQSKRSLTDDEQQLLSDVKTTLDSVQGVYDKYYDIYSKAAQYNVENIVENYLNTDEGKIENVGKDTFKSWSKGLLDQAENAEQKRQLETLIENQFPDLTKYFDNLDKAKSMFVKGRFNAKPISDYLEKLSPEDLEIATQIPDLFADGLDGATTKIESWKSDPKNKIAPEVDTSELNTIIETTSKKVKLITTAMEEMNDTGSISSSTYGEIVEMGGNFADCLEIQNGKLKLNIEKLKKLERQEILNAIAAKNLAISELNVAAAMAGQAHDADKVEEIRKQITALEEERAVLWQINDEIANAKPKESGSGGSGSNSDPWKEQFDKEYSEKQHLLAMEQLSEEEYLDWLDDAYKKYFSDWTKYQDEYYKYEEEVYKGRKQLAEDYFDEEQKLFEDRVSNLETQIEITTKTSESSDGTKLNTKEKYDYIRSGYQEIINIIEERINEIVQAGVEGHEDLLAELEQQLDEYKEKLADVFKDAVEEEKDYIEKQKKAYSDSFDERIDKMKEQQKVAEKAAQAEIDAIDEKIDALKEANEKAEEANEIEKARQDLVNASQSTRQVYGADGSISFQVDQDKVNEAQEKLDKLLQEQQINILEEQKQDLEDAKNKASESYDRIIENLETEKVNGEKRFDILLDVLDRYLNPDNGESNSDVWKTLAHIEGAKYEDGTWKDKDGNIIDIDKLLETAEANTDDKKTETDNAKTDTKDNGVISGTMERMSFGSEKLDTENEVKDSTESAIETFFSNLEKKLNMPSGSINLENAMQVFRNSPMMNFNPYGAMNDRTGLANKEYVSNVNNQQNITPTFTGDIVISNPVGNSDDLAKELVLNIPIAFQKQMYSNLK